MFSIIRKNIKKFALFFIMAIVLIIIDQITKRVSYNYLYNKSNIVLIKNILEFAYVENRGAAFGIMQNMRVVFVVLTIFVIIYMLFLLYKMKMCKHNVMYFIILNLIFSGAIGNFIDRLKNGYVVDFIYFKLIDFPVFNVADSYITIGCILLLIGLFTIYRNDNLW